MLLSALQALVDSKLVRTYTSVPHTVWAQKLGPTTQLQTSATQHFYFKAIKAAKSKHRTQFLANVDVLSVWTAKKFAYGRASDRFPSFPSATLPSAINSALLNHFFPAQCPSTSSLVLFIYSSAPPVSTEEIVDALRKSSNTSAPGPDGIPFCIWKKVYKLTPSLLTSPRSLLLILGHHPTSLKGANGNTTNHLPLDALCHLIKDTIMEIKPLPPANPHLCDTSSADPSYLQVMT